MKPCSPLSGLHGFLGSREQVVSRPSHQEEYLEQEEMKHRGRLAGVAVPLFSLRRNGDAGCGDFASLEAFAPLVQQMGMSIVQLLPIEDTTLYGDDRDSYPYRPIASTVLNPIYIALDKLPPLQDQSLECELQQEALRLHRQSSISYTEVWQLKRHWLWAAYREQAGCSKHFQELRKRYDDYHLKGHQGKKAPAWYHWARMRTALELSDQIDIVLDTELEQLDVYEQSHAQEVCALIELYLYCYVIAQEQMLEAVGTLHRYGVSLMGDLPVGVALQSVDVRRYESCFNSLLSCGAPPDYFTPDGQNWGFPTYRWDSPDIEPWWRERIAYLERYYDYLRVDHVLGFFRMWSIPRDGRTGMLGYFIPSKRYSEEEIERLGLRDTLRAEWIAPVDGVTTQEILWITCLDGGYAPRYDVEHAAPFAQLTDEQQEVMRTLCHDYFYRANEELWRKTGMKRLSLLKSLTTMQLCAEDLGMVPQCVYPVLEELEILKLYVERMPKSAGIEFEAAPYFSVDSVATTSTHDCEPLRLWWQQDEARSRRYYDLFLTEYGVPYDAILSPALAEIIIHRHLESASLLCILPMQDWLALDPTHCATVAPESERINDPGNPDQVWSYSMPITVEELPDKWMAQVSQMVIRSNRSQS